VPLGRRRSEKGCESTEIGPRRFIGAERLPHPYCDRSAKSLGLKPSEQFTVKKPLDTATEGKRRKRGPSGYCLNVVLAGGRDSNPSYRQAGCGSPRFCDQKVTKRNAIFFCVLWITACYFRHCGPSVLFRPTHVTTGRWREPPTHRRRAVQLRHRGNKPCRARTSARQPMTEWLGG